MRVPNEIIPISAEQSTTKDNDEEKYGAENAIDLDLETRSFTEADGDGNAWLIITLDKIYCVEKVIRYKEDGNPSLSWTCAAENGCSNCVGSSCSAFTLTVSTEGAVSDLPSESDCKYGDMVKMETIESDRSFNAKEVAVIGKEGRVN